MNQCALPLRPGENPFCTRRLAPGAAPFLTADPEQWRVWLSRLLEGPGRHWQILGPHGVGKSSLAARLARQLRRSGRKVLMLRGSTRGFGLADRQSHVLRLLPSSQAPRDQWWILDGLDVAPWWSRRLWLYQARRAEGVLAVAHRDFGLPTLAALQPDERQFVRVVRHLMRQAPAWIDDADARRCFARAGGNLREALFLLYDVYEARSRSLRLCHTSPKPEF